MTRAVEFQGLGEGLISRVGSGNYPGSELKGLARNCIRGRRVSINCSIWKAEAGGLKAITCYIERLS